MLISPAWPESAHLSGTGLEPGTSRARGMDLVESLVGRREVASHTGAGEWGRVLMRLLGGYTPSRPS